MPLFSIIIPTFNSAATLRGCLDSVLGQTCRDVEILIQDGGSTDGTAAIVQAAAEQAPGIIRWVSEKDKGIYDAMNRALARTAGEWVYFLGSDDYLHDEQVLADVAAVLQETTADIVYGDAIVASNHGRHGGPFDLNRLLTYGNLCHQTIFYRQRIFSLIGNYNLSYPIVADWDFNIRCFRDTTLLTQYMQRDIVLYNDVTGISSTSQNDPFYQLVPAFHIKRANNLEREKQDILRSREFQIGSSIYSFLKKTGLLTLLRKLR
ncbi:glycosyltransferase family 2 protein [Hymenobacter metallilatus]|uniref:Glycosyltransferase n=1 Tax=Hymenobacter metallilatus TaxID=2493666 RepID=A0A3R9NL55_9BACT|nr:glycosyltransferase family 2 protein [Hymenobacter metallilatus]RSK36043.1 glycosyltransferase [Hymenobacter metallilatus]